MQLFKIDQYTKITAERINRIFTALETLRSKFSVGSSFNTDVAHQDSIIPFENNYVQQIQNNIQTIETSQYVPASYSTQLDIPQSVGTIIKTLEGYNHIWDVLQEIDSLCVHDGAFNSADYQTNYHTPPPCPDYADFYSCNNHTVNTVCGAAYGGFGGNGTCYS